MDAYSEDLRRIDSGSSVHERGMGKSEAARTFGVNLSSVKRYVKAVQEGRSLSPGKAPGKQSKLSLRAQKDSWKLT
jgi:transposase